jgi:hypothetical protein
MVAILLDSISQRLSQVLEFRSSDQDKNLLRNPPTVGLKVGEAGIVFWRAKRPQTLARSLRCQRRKKSSTHQSKLITSFEGPYSLIRSRSQRPSTFDFVFA